MLFTGIDLTAKRNFFTQTGSYGFTATCTVDNTTGQYLFGLSGRAGVLEFRLESGHLYYGTQFLHSYRSYQEFTLEARFSSGATDVIKDGVPLVYGGPKATGYFDYFYFKRANAGMGASFDVNVSGNNLPLYTIQQQGYLLASGQAAVTGWFANQSAFPLNVFDSNISASQVYDFGKLDAVLGAGSSGSFAYSGDFDVLDLTQPILTTFNTSFDDTTVLFTVVDARTLSRFVYLTGPASFSFNSTGILNRDLTYLNYSGGFVVGNYPASLTFSLGYVSGSGVFPGYTKTFTGGWDFLTGVDNNSLVSMKRAGSFDGRMISGSGQFAPNSLVNFQVTHIVSGSNNDVAALVISGAQVLNPITQTLLGSNS